MESSGTSILYLCDYQAPYGGNFIASMLKLDEVLKADGCRTSYLFPKGAEGRFWLRFMREKGISVSFLPDGGFLHKLQALLRRIREEDVKILHVHFGLFALAEMAVLLSPGTALVLHFHSDFSAGKPAGPREKIRRAAKKIPETLIGKKRIAKITVSEASARTEPDCVSVRNALVPERAAPEYRTGKEVREEYSIPEGAKLLLAFGWSPYIKGVDLAAEAAAALRRDSGEDIRLGIVFGRTCGEEQMRRFIRENTGLTGEEDWLVLFPPAEDVFRYHDAADVMLSPSRSETFSYALLEAVYSGKPAAASDIPGQRWARQFDTVFFFPYENAEGLADAVRKAFSAPEADLRRSRETAESEYGIGAWTDGIRGVYRDLLGQ